MDAATGDREILAKDYAEQGRILDRGQRYHEAVKAYDKALKADNTYANAHLWRAQVQSQLQNYPEAGESLDQYVKRGGRPAVEVYRASRLRPGQLRQYGKAIEDYTLALAMQPNDPSTQAARGWAYLATRSYELALHDFDEAIRLTPENGDAYNGRGYVRVKLDQYLQAVEDAKTALKRGPQSCAAARSMRLAFMPRRPKRSRLIQDSQTRG